MSRSHPLFPKAAPRSGRAKSEFHRESAKVDPYQWHTPQGYSSPSNSSDQSPSFRYSESVEQSSYSNSHRYSTPRAAVAEPKYQPVPAPKLPPLPKGPIPYSPRVSRNSRSDENINTNMPCFVQPSEPPPMPDFEVSAIAPSTSSNSTASVDGTTSPAVSIPNLDWSQLKNIVNQITKQDSGSSSQAPNSSTPSTPSSLNTDSSSSHSQPPQVETNSSSPDDNKYKNLPFDVLLERLQEITDNRNKVRSEKEKNEKLIGHMKQDLNNFKPKLDQLRSLKSKSTELIKKFNELDDEQNKIIDAMKSKDSKRSDESIVALDLSKKSPPPPNFSDSVLDSLPGPTDFSRKPSNPERLATTVTPVGKIAPVKRPSIFERADQIKKARHENPLNPKPAPGSWGTKNIRPARIPARRVTFVAKPSPSIDSSTATTDASS